ncbi:hypothetical protein HDU67_008423 [Dinochytrium kinnereticum]|nr:hypothetical protein HDU67_008423 [Dinochytrium kinnereticum]
MYDYPDPDFNQSLGNLQSLASLHPPTLNFGVIHFFTQWCQAVAHKPHYDTIVFKEKLPSIWNEMKAVPMITWQPACFDPDSRTGDGFLKEVLGGKHDGFLERWGKALLEFVRGEDGVGGCPGKNPSITAADYINFWRYTRSRLDRLGFLRSQIQWVWCPNNFDSGAVTAEELYPGNDYVDWVCFDMYNGAGIFNDNAGWSPPAPLTTPILTRLNTLTTGKKPITIGEFGTVLHLPSPGLPGKSDWLVDLYTQAAGNWNLSMTVYFNQDVWAVRGYGQPDVEGWRRVVWNGSLGLVGGREGVRGLIEDEVFWGRWGGDGGRVADGGVGPVVRVDFVSAGVGGWFGGGFVWGCLVAGGVWMVLEGLS